MALNELLARLDALRAQVDALRPLDPDQEARLVQKLNLEWNYHSNAIEGNTLTLARLGLSCSTASPPRASRFGTTWTSRP